jgi:nucleoside-diphosphate-sugar epimerase
MGTAARWGKNQVKPPEYFPLDDKVYTRSEDPYSIAKWLGEEIGEAFARRNPWMSIASMRFNGMWDDDYFEKIAKSPISDPWVRCQGFWTYLHIRDAATACVNSIESESWKGHNRFFLNASDTMITTPTVDAINIVYPDVPVKTDFAKYQAPISIELAECLLDWRPKFSWRDKKFQP